jgi:hypothetical protein
MPGKRFGVSSEVLRSRRSKTITHSKARTNLTIFNPPRLGVVGLAGPVVSGIAQANLGSYAGRQTRFAARSQRRYGDWSVLGVPTALLWLEEAEVEDDILDVENPFAQNPFAY